MLEGKTLVYIPGALPEFPEVVAAEPAVAVGEIVAAAVGTLAGVVGAIAGAARIRKFDRPRTPRPPRDDRGERPFRKAGGERGRPAKPFGERGGRASRLASGNPMRARARLRAAALENASGGRFSAIVLAASGRSSHVRGMKSGSQDRGARRVTVLHVLQASGAIARTTREARVRRESFAEVRGSQVRIAGRERSVRFARGVKVNAKEADRVQRSRFVHAVKASRSRFVLVVRVIARDLHHVRRGPTRRGEKAIAQGPGHGQRSRFVQGLRASAEDMHHVQRRHFVLGVRVNVKGLHRGPRSRFVRGLRVSAEDIRRVQRSRIRHGQKAIEELRRRGRIGGRRAAIVHGRRVIGNREARPALAVRQRSAPRRSTAAASVRLVVTGSLRERAKRPERAGLEANRSQSLDRRMTGQRVARKPDRGQARPSRGVTRRSSCKA